MILGGHLQRRGYDTLTAAVAGDDQERSLDTEAFHQGLAESLAEGRFRIVIVLDAAPDELVKLVGYLEAVTDKLLIDLVTVSAYDVGGARILVPQRVEPERWRTEAARAPTAPRETGYLVAGADDFLTVIATAPQDQQVFLQRLTDWAVALGQRGLAQVSTYHGKAGITTLLPRLSDGAGLVTIYKDTRSAYLQFWRSVFERRAPQALAAVEAAVGEQGVKQGNVVREVSDELLSALTVAYEEAAMGQLST